MEIAFIIHTWGGVGGGLWILEIHGRGQYFPPWRFQGRGPFIPWKFQGKGSIIRKFQGIKVHSTFLEIPGRGSFWIKFQGLMTCWWKMSSTGDVWKTCNLPFSTMEYESISLPISLPISHPISLPIGTCTVSV